MLLCATWRCLSEAYEEIFGKFLKGALMISSLKKSFLWLESVRDWCRLVDADWT